MAQKSILDILAENPAGTLQPNDALVISRPASSADPASTKGATIQHIISAAAEQITKDSIGLGNVENTSDLDKPISTATQTAINAEVVTRQNAIATVNKRIDNVEGQGGYLPAHNFGGAAPTLEELVAYYCQTIWADANGVFAFDGAEPKDSTWTMQDGTVHYAREIFNATRVTNLFDHHTWIITNTPNTVPPVFYFADIGQDTVGGADADTAGVAKLYNETGSNADGAITQAAATAAIEAAETKTADAQNDIDTHSEDKTNPHGVTKEQVGLGNVENTADLNKIVKSAMNLGKISDGVTADTIFANPPLSNMGAISYHYFEFHVIPNTSPIPNAYTAWNIITLNLNRRRAVQIATQIFESNGHQNRTFIRSRHVDNDDFSQWQAWEEVGGRMYFEQGGYQRYAEKVVLTSTNRWCKIVAFPASNVWRSLSAHVHTYAIAPNASMTIEAVVQGWSETVAWSHIPIFISNSIRKWSNWDISRSYHLQIRRDDVSGAAELWLYAPVSTMTIYCTVELLYPYTTKVTFSNTAQANEPTYVLPPQSADGDISTYQ